MLLLNSVPSLLIDQVLRDIYDNRRTQVSFATPMDFFFNLLSGLFCQWNPVDWRHEHTQL